MWKGVDTRRARASGRGGGAVVRGQTTSAAGGCAGGLYKAWRGGEGEREKRGLSRDGISGGAAFPCVSRASKLVAPRVAWAKLGSPTRWTTSLLLRNEEQEEFPACWLRLFVVSAMLLCWHPPTAPSSEGSSTNVDRTVC